MDLARDEAVAAYAVAIDPGCNPALAVPHLVEGWRWFYLAVEREPPPSDTQTLAVWVRKQCLRSVGEARAERAGDFVEKHAPRSELRVPLPLKEAEILDQLGVLRDRVDAERRRLGELPPAYSRRALWARRIATWGGIGIAAFMIALRPWQWEGIGSWRGAYYPGYELRGDPDVRREVDVDFDWGILPPTDSIQSDRFGARFDTCLVLEEDVEATFQLIADDGARLTIDDEMVLDFLEPAGVPPTVLGMEWELEAGVHHVKVEYREDDDEAQVHLLATFDPDVPPEPLPARMLEYPGDEIDDDDACGHVAP
jgi:hypothetical protein